MLPSQDTALRSELLKQGGERLRGSPRSSSGTDGHGGADERVLDPTKPQGDEEHRVLSRQLTAQDNGTSPGPPSSTVAEEAHPAASLQQQEAASASGRKDALRREQGQDVSPGTVFLLTAVMAAASGLGAVPFFFVGALSARWSALANAVACGVMLAASFDLVHEGEPYGAGLVILGVMLGGVALPCTHCTGCLHNANTTDPYATTAEESGCMPNGTT